MALFTKTQQQMVYELLVSENPGLAGVVLGTHVEFVGTPVAGSGTVTTAKLRGKRGAGFTGIKAFTYNRLDIGRLFVNVGISPLLMYSATQTTDLISVFNQRFGTNLVASDIANTVWGPVATSQNVRFNANGQGSYVYTGYTEVFQWQRGVQQFTDYYPKRDLTVLTVPDLMLKAFRIDFSDALATLQAHDTTVAFSSASSTAQAIVAMLAARTGLPVTLSATTTPGNGLYDLSGFTLSFTTPDVLMDARYNFRQIAVLTPPAVYSNQYVPIYLHFDKVGKLRTEDLVTVTQLSGLNAPTK